MKVTRAMVLAAGMGRRMLPLTETTAKPLITVQGKALIDYALDRMADNGVERAVVNVHHFADKIEAHLAQRTAAPAVDISDERDGVLETGGGLVRARPLLGEAPVLVTNTDAIFRADDPAEKGFPQLTEGFDPAKEDARLLLVRKDRALGLDTAGDFHLEPDGRLRRRGAEGGAPYYYTGTQVLNPAILDGWPEEKFSLNEIWNRSLEAGRLTGAVFEGDWLHVGDPQSRDEAETRMRAA